MATWSLVQICGAVGVACAAWNLFGDLYLLDFYTAHMSMDDFAMVRDDLREGYLFQFNSNNWWVVFVAQSGGWMYPIWACVTAIPLYIGLRQQGGNPWRDVAPCALMVYGLCVVGGGLHNAFHFLTVLPSVYHHSSDNGWSDLAGTQDFSVFLKTAQTRVIQHVMVGCIPGMIASNVAGIWIAVLVHFGDTKFPKSFNFFNPMVTSFWVQILGALLPDPFGFYFSGCLGTWGLLVFNLGTTYYLWQDGTGIASPCSDLLLPKGVQLQSVAMDYSSVEHRGYGTATSQLS